MAAALSDAVHAARAELAAAKAWRARADEVAEAYAEAVREVRFDGTPLVRAVRAERDHHLSPADEEPEIVFELDPSLRLPHDALREALGAPAETGVPWVHVGGVGIGVSPTTASPDWVREGLTRAIASTVEHRDTEAAARAAALERLSDAERSLRAALEARRPL